VPLQQELAPAEAGGAPGIDGQDFADIEAYGVERWLAELALALRQETYRPGPIKRVFIPKADGKLRPLGISGVWDRVCITAALLVLEPIFVSVETGATGDLVRPRLTKGAATDRVDLKSPASHSDSTDSGNIQRASRVTSKNAVRAAGPPAA
jgi:hypothetical protein